MNYDHKHQMAFLLSLAALPIGGCIINGSDDDDDGAGTDTNPSTMTADDGDSTGAMTMTTSPEDSGTLEDSGTSAGSVDDTGTTGGEIPAVCIDVGAHFEKCGFTDAEDKVAECVYYVDDPEASAECIELNEAYYACLAETACEEFEGKTNPCEVELDMVIEGCVGGATTGIETSGTDSGSTGG